MLTHCPIPCCMYWVYLWCIWTLISWLFNMRTSRNVQIKMHYLSNVRGRQTWTECTRVKCFQILCPEIIFWFSPHSWIHYHFLLCHHFSYQILRWHQWISNLKCDSAFYNFLFFSLFNISIPSLVKSPNKKAEKTKKTAVKNPNSVSEGEQQYNPIKKGE